MQGNIGFYIFFLYLPYMVPISFPYVFYIFSIFFSAQTLLFIWYFDKTIPLFQKGFPTQIWPKPLWNNDLFFSVIVSYQIFSVAHMGPSIIGKPQENVRTTTVLHGQNKHIFSVAFFGFGIWFGRTFWILGPHLEEFLWVSRCFFITVFFF